MQNRNLQNNESRGSSCGPSHGSATYRLTSFSSRVFQGLITLPSAGAVWAGYMCMCARVSVCVCCTNMYVCWGRRRAGRCAPSQVNQLGGADLEAGPCQGLLSWMQVLGGADLFLESFSQGLNRGTFPSAITIKIIIINTAVAYISPARLLPDLRTLGQQQTCRHYSLTLGPGKP